MKAISPKGLIRFVPSVDKKLPKEEQTVFILKPLTVEEEAILDDAQWRVINGKREFSFARKCLAAIHLALVGVENFSDEDGNKFNVEREEFEHETLGIKEIKEEFLAKIPKSVRDEIALAILTSMNPTEEQRKN